MSYVVLARKWRPMRFEDLIGQDHVTRTLGNAIASDRVAHQRENSVNVRSTLDVIREMEMRVVHHGLA